MMPFPFKYFSRTRKQARLGSQILVLSDLGTPRFPRRDISCEHTHKEYQPYEPENNAPESLTCEDCGADLALPGGGI
tara:strand:- start:361 stop:591 length:231 start_codon:yes stop_codon:yes gene_type:complete